MKLHSLKNAVAVALITCGILTSTTSHAASNTVPASIEILSTSPGLGSFSWFWRYFF